MRKTTAKSPLVLATASLLIRNYIRLVQASGRWDYHGMDHFEAAAAKGKGVILAFWHGRLLMAPAVRSLVDQRVFMLISAHRDGEMIANSVKPFGIEFIRGSAANPKKPEKNKSGAAAIAQMRAALEAGHVVGLTPDGPRGPREVAQMGVVKLAQMTGAPILPAAYSVRHGRRLNSWDGFLLAWPFSKGVYLAGPPLEVAQDCDAVALESARASVENALRTVTRRADELAGRIGERAYAPETGPGPRAQTDKDMADKELTYRS